MRTCDELKAIVHSARWSHINAHVHTYLCDGQPEMTVEKIGLEARRAEVDLIILTPHFHRQVSDASETLYEDSKEEILWRLRDEIDAWETHEKAPRFLLSTEADILNREGEISLNPCQRTVDALDCVTPTMNYNAALPLHAVHLTYGRDRDSLYDSGEYGAMAHAAGGIENVLRAMYDMEENAIRTAKYPSILGHVFAAHSFAGRHNWFGMVKEHVPVMKESAARVIEACAKTGALIDVTGIIRPREITAAEHEKMDGFLYDFQKWFLDQCAQHGVPAIPGSDAHSLSGIDKALCYSVLYPDYEKRFSGV